MTAREDLKAFLLKEIDEEQTPAEFKTGELALKASWADRPRGQLEGD